MVADTTALATPFRGLAPFGETELDALLFFGRERETEIAVANLLAARLTLLYGPSGVGKSSLLRAGVARRIRELADRRAIGRGPDGAVVVFSSWADDPIEGLAAAIAKEVTSLVRRPFAPPPAGARLVDVVEHWSSVLDGDLYLVLDQLEEHFVYESGDAGPGSLIDELPEVILRPRLRANVLLSLRDDTLSQLDAFKGRIPNLFANYLRLDRLDHAAATAAILGPLQRWNDLVPAQDRIEIEPELVEAVLAQAAVAGEIERIEPPYLQLVMERLWDEELGRGSNLLRASTLTELGGAGAIVQDHLDRALSVLDEGEQDAAARMFEHLVTPSGTKVAHRAADLAQFARVPTDAAGPMLSALSRERILRPLDDGGDGSDRYEIFHDVLAGAVLGWRQRRELDQERATARRRQRRLASFAALAIAGLIVMSAVTIFALTQRSAEQRQTRRARAREMSARALLEQAADPQASLLLALQAAQLEPSVDAEEVLRSTLQTARLRRVLRIGSPATAVAYSPTGSGVAVGSTAGMTRIWDPRRNRVVARLRAHGPVRAIRYDDRGARILTVAGGHAELWAATSGRHLADLDQTGVADAIFVGDGRVATAGTDGVRLWDLSGRPLGRFVPSANDLRVVATPDGRRFAALERDSQGHVLPRLYAGSSGRLLRVLPQKGATDLAFSPDGKTLATSSADGTTVLSWAEDGTELRVLDDAGIHHIAFSPDSSMLAAGSTDGGVRVWLVGTGARFFYFLGHTNPVKAVAFDPSGTYLVSSSTDGTARVWALRGWDAGKQIGLLAGNGAAVVAAAYAPDGKSLVTAGADGTGRSWDTQIEQRLHVTATERGPVTAAGFANRDGLILARVGDTIRTLRGAHVASSLSRPGGVTALGPSGLVAVAQRGEVTVSRAPSGTTLATLRPPGRVAALSFRRDGRELASAEADGSLVVWNLESKQVVHRFSAGRGITRVALSPSADEAASGGADGVVRLWSADGKLLHTLAGHGQAVTDVRFDPSGGRVVTAYTGSSENVIEWDSATGDQLHTPAIHFGTVTAASFSADGRWILTAGPISAAVWPADTGRLLFYLRGPTGLLTGAEWAPDGYRVVTSERDGFIRTYTCEICRPLPALIARARQQLRAAD